MSEDSQGTESTNASPEIAPIASNTDRIDGPFTPVSRVQEVQPFLIIGSKDDYSLDFRIRPETVTSVPPVVFVEEEEEEGPDPKDSSAKESVESSSSSGTKTTTPESELSVSPDETANAEKDSGQPKENAPSGTQIF